MKHLKSALALSLMVGGLMVSPSFANNVAIIHAQTQGHAMATCGSPNPAHCVGTGSSKSSGSKSSGGNYYANPITYFWVAVQPTPSVSNVPMFVSLQSSFATDYPDRYLAYLTLYGLDQCAKRYGATCQLVNHSYGYKNSYVAVAGTAKKGASEGVTATDWAHEGKAQAQQRAIQLCQTIAQKNSLNPNDCRVIDSRTFAKAGNKVNENTLYHTYREDLRLDCKYLPPDHPKSC